MKKFDIEVALVNAAPKDSSIDAIFTKKVIDELRMRPHHIMHKSGRSSLASWLIRLPKFALVLLAIVALLTVSGAAYAVVETIKIQKRVEVEKSGKNDNGREQLTIGFNSCEEQKKIGTIYEIKRDSGLSSEEAAKTLEARCELDTITDWLKNDSAIKPILEQDRFLATMPAKIIGKVATVTQNEITLDFATRHEKFIFPSDARVIENNEIKDRSNVQPGDSVLLFSPYYISRRGSSQDPNNYNVLFKLQQQPTYYSTLMQWYVGARGACSNNPERSCLLHNAINSVFLTVTQGGSNASLDDTKIVSRNIQGRVVEYTNSYIKIDTGNGIMYTIQTPSNIIEKYNGSTVYGLKNYDPIYANTNPEALKITKGDSLDINYAESEGQMSPSIVWQNIYTISLMVERTAKDMGVLTKY